MDLESELMSTNKAAELWGITARRVQILCSKGLVEGAIKMERTWIIPQSSVKPIDGRIKAAKRNENSDIH